MSAGPERDASTWRPLDHAEGLWQTVRVRQGAPLRSVALRLADGRLAIYSPIRGLGSEAHRALRDLGTPALLVAPNHFHNLGLHEHATAYPDASIVSSAVAAPRTSKKSGHLVGDEARLREALPRGVSLLVPPDTRNGELWLSIATRGGRAWIVGDAFFNLPRTPRSPMGLLLAALGMCPGLRIGSTFRWLLRDRAGYRRWLLERLAEESPTILIPCHGDILADAELPMRLRRLAEARL